MEFEKILEKYTQKEKFSFEPNEGLKEKCNALHQGSCLTNLLFIS